MKDVILSAMITIIIGFMLIAMVSCSTTKKVEQAPMKRVAVPYWG